MLILDTALEELRIILPDPIFENVPVVAFTHLVILKNKLATTKLVEKVREWLVVSCPRVSGLEVSRPKTS